MANEHLPRSVRRLFRLPWRNAASTAQDVDDELRFHVDMRAAELRAAGLDAESAQAEAWRAFGSVSDVREHAIAAHAGVARRERVFETLNSVAHDVRFALRQARRGPLFTVTAVVTLSLGIGANAAIFSVVHRLLIAPLPFADGNRLAWLTRMGAQGHVLVLPDAAVATAWKTRAHSLQSMGGASEGDYEVRVAGRAEMVKGGAMSATLLPTLGVRPALGRGFEELDEHAGATPVAMLGHEEWQTRFGGSTDVIGRTITVDSVARVIVGVLPAGFVVPFTGTEVPRAVWVPLGDTSTQETLIGRLRDGVAMDAVNHELTALAAQASAHTSFADWGAKALRAQDLLGPGLRQGVLLLFGAVGLVLLIACANVSNLLLVRAWSRQREIGIRMALGAGRARLLRQFGVESLTLAIAGGIGGLAFASALVRVFVKLRPPGLDDLSRVRIEPAVLGWTMLVSIATGLLFGLAPEAVLAGGLPPRTGVNTAKLQVDGRGGSESPVIGMTGFVMAQPGFFKTAGIRLRGRTFEGDSLRLDSLPPNEIIINERLAKRLWPGADAVGQRLHVGTTIKTVVGVANDLRVPGRSGDIYDFQLYASWVSLNGRMVTFLFRSSLDDRSVTAAAREAMWSVSSQLQFLATSRSDDELRAMLAPAKFATALVSAFAVIALCLSVVGLYGVIAYSVGQRTREIGVRMALGAQPGEIARLVLVRGATLVVAGLACGIALSLAGSRVLRSYMYGVGDRDPLTYVTIVVLLGAAGLLAAYLPARRAMRVDPVVALSTE